LTLQVSDKTGVELSDEAIKRISTVRDLLQEVRDASGSEAVASTTINPEALLTEDQQQWLQPLSPFQQTLSSILFSIFRSLMRFLFKLKVEGLENLPSQGNFVLTPNHTSMLDAPTLAAALPPAHMRQTRWAGAADIMLANPIMRLISRLFGVLPVERFTGGTGVKNLALAIAALRQGKNLVWFPEGRITTTGQMLPFREGIGLILDQQPALVVPVYIQGASEAMPVDASWPKFKPVKIIFGPPVDPVELERQGQGESAPARIVQELQGHVAALGKPQPVLAEVREPRP
jgi:long-chain acyl-CoA synthetase